MYQTQRARRVCAASNYITRHERVRAIVVACSSDGGGGGCRDDDARRPHSVCVCDCVCVCVCLSACVAQNL